MVLPRLPEPDRRKAKVWWGRVSLAFLVLGPAVFALAVAAAPAKKKLTAENVMDLLSSGVAVQRVTFLVLERGINFELNLRLEQAFRDGGADPTLIMALKKEQAPEQVTSQQPPGGQASSTTTPSPRPKRSLPPGTPPTGLQIRSKPGGVTIFVDNELMGQTNPDDGHLDVVGLMPGKHRLRATCEGYQDLEGPVEVATGKLEETPVWLAKTEAPVAPAPAASSLPSGKKFLVRHTHKAIEGLGGGGFCQGWMVVNVGYVRYISTDSPHTYLMNTSEIRDAKPSSAPGGFAIKLDFGRKYEFVAVDDQGHEIGVGPVLTEIRYSMGQ